VQLPVLRRELGHPDGLVHVKVAEHLRGADRGPGDLQAGDLRRLDQADVLLQQVAAEAAATGYVSLTVVLMLPGKSILDCSGRCLPGRVTVNPAGDARTPQTSGKAP
jgi:hypothetical protein